MLNLFTDTKDIIEEKWAGVICSNFPAYADFWNKFIGVRKIKKSNRLIWYKYSYPPIWRKDQKATFRSHIEELFMAHYSIFCNLAGAHYQLKQCNLSLGLSFSEKHFRHWEAFESCYQHMGNVVNSVHLFWEKIFIIEGKLTQRQKNQNLNKNKIKPLWKNLLRDERKLYLYRKMMNMFERKGQILVIRNNIVHYARVFAVYLGNQGYGLPYRLSRNIRWSQKKIYKTGILAHKKAEKHLTELEILLNDLQKIAIKKFDNYLINEGVSVKY